MRNRKSVTLYMRNIMLNWVTGPGWQHYKPVATLLSYSAIIVVIFIFLTCANLHIIKKLLILYYFKMATIALQIFGMIYRRRHRGGKGGHATQ